MMFRYRCSGCGGIFARHECVVDDDPMVPFGPELVCPHCHSLVTLHAPPFVMGVAVVIALAIGLAVGCLLNRGCSR